MSYDRSNELGNGVRLGGVFDSTMVGGRKAIWKGRPPVDEHGERFGALLLATSFEGVDSGQTVSIYAEAGSSEGGIATRRFSIGGGLSADLRLGHYEHVVCRVETNPIPTGLKIYFVWAREPRTVPSPLWTFLSYQGAGVTVDLPEGADLVYPQNAGVITWQIPEFATTFVQAATGGVPFEAAWSAFSYSVPTRFLIRMRGL